jgi:hypothetical protein
MSALPRPHKPSHQVPVSSCRGGTHRARWRRHREVRQQHRLGHPAMGYLGSLHKQRRPRRFLFAPTSAPAARQRSSAVPTVAREGHWSPEVLWVSGLRSSADRSPSQPHRANTQQEVVREAGSIGRLWQQTSALSLVMPRQIPTPGVPDKVSPQQPVPTPSTDFHAGVPFGSPDRRSTNKDRFRVAGSHSPFLREVESSCQNDRSSVDSKSTRNELKRMLTRIVT